ncbi:glutaminase [Brachybacterium alimentarium]|uniref:Glutaminase n=1 Tax=Brachybacterium alimentarium TaxID=47845 RepID=A0A2A3YM15_9MICO|nr:glutaminase A [Brachybacterium alimentarium]PCC40792.1 glutaminase [Brachybacterium alimentarium]RCS79717.1 glutaminase [Brachybacterium alimentarium]
MFESDVLDVPQRALTGDLPEESRVGELVRDAHSRFAPVTHGTVADYIPVLAEADPDLFGLSLVEVDGTVHDAGDTVATFSIQSISKAFVLALVCDAIGHEEVHRIVGVNNTGLPFNSVIALELNDGSPMNPMVNAGAIATTALMPGDTAEEKWWAVREGLSRFAGRSLELDERVLRSESASNHRNQGISDLLTSYGRLQGRSEEMVDVYTRQCSLLVTADDLAIMGATLADGGLNPITREQVVSPEVCRDTLSVLAACGMYELSGEWLFEIGLPAKSGVSGGIVAVAPGKGALGAFSPPLDRAGNSVRGQRACSYLSRALGLNLFASRPRPAKEGDHDA